MVVYCVSACTESQFYDLCWYRFLQLLQLCLIVALVSLCPEHEQALPAKSCPTRWVQRHACTSTDQTREEMPFWYCLKRLGNRRSSTPLGAACSRVACRMRASRSRSSTCTCGHLQVQSLDPAAEHALQKAKHWAAISALPGPENDSTHAELHHKAWHGHALHQGLQGAETKPTSKATQLVSGILQEFNLNAGTTA